MALRRSSYPGATPSRGATSGRQVMQGLRAFASLSGRQQSKPAAYFYRKICSYFNAFIAT